jgi:nicotinamidase-related amidase
MISQPTLILMDCQREQLHNIQSVTGDRSETVVARIRKILVTARHSGWSVVHSQRRLENIVAAPQRLEYGPIPELSPLAREPVFLRSALSAYSNRSFERFIGQRQDGPCLLVGFSAPYSLLATVFDATAHGHELSVIPEAAGCPSVGPRSANTIRDVTMDLMDRINRTVSWSEYNETWVKNKISININSIGGS